MASIVVAKLHPPPPAISGRQTLFGTVHTSTLFLPTSKIDFESLLKMPSHIQILESDKSHWQLRNFSCSIYVSSTRFVSYLIRSTNILQFLLIVTVSVVRQGHLAITAKASSESSDSLSSPSVVKSVKNIWDRPEDRIAVIGLGIAAIVGFWAASNFVTAIDRLPLIPGVFEFIGILFSSWFVYRYLLFKPNRKELLQAINKTLSDILDQ